MRKKTNQTSQIITGVAALFVVFAGTVQAIPITWRDHNAQPALHFVGQNNQVRSRVIAAASHVSGSVATLNGRGHHVIRVLPVHHFGHLATPILTPVTDQGAVLVSGLHAPILPVLPVNLPHAPVIVATGGGTTTPFAVGAPDGGTTAMMLGGAFCGLALVRKKLKA